MTTWQPDVKFEDGVYRFDLPDGDEFVIVPKQKDFTDEEIRFTARKYLGIRATEITGVCDFARAILRKAQEADKIESLGTVNIGGVHFRNGKEVK